MSSSFPNSYHDFEFLSKCILTTSTAFIPSFHGIMVFKVCVIVTIVSAIRTLINFPLLYIMVIFVAGINSYIA